MVRSSPFWMSCVCLIKNNKITTKKKVKMGENCMSNIFSFHSQQKHIISHIIAISITKGG